MEIKDYIKSQIKEKNRTNLWVAEEMGINYKTFVGKLNRGSITAEDLLKISVVLDINLEKMKFDLKYQTSYDENTKEIISSNKLETKNTELKSDNISSINKSIEIEDKPIKSKGRAPSNIDNNMMNRLKSELAISGEIGSIRLGRK